MYSLEDILFFFRTAVALKTPLAPSSFTSLLRAKNRHFIYSPNARVLRNKRYAPSHKHKRTTASARATSSTLFVRTRFFSPLVLERRERERLKRERRERLSAPIETRSLPENEGSPGSFLFLSFRFLFAAPKRSGRGDRPARNARATVRDASAHHFFPMRNCYYQLSFYRSKAVLRRTAFGE